MKEALTRPAVQTALVVVGVGALIGFALALREPPPTPPVEDGLVPTGELRPAFASYFVHFFPGRTADGSRPRANKQLLRSAKFLTGERVGLRVETAPEIERSILVEVRFLSTDTHEELPALRDDRQRFRIRPGLRTYCCLRIPREPGAYSLGLLVNSDFIAFLPIGVIEPPFKLEGGLLSRPKE